MNDVETRILTRAKELFFQLGVKTVTMDDIASALGMSKKTIYQFYKNKAEIVYEVALAHFREEVALSNTIAEEANDAIDEEFRTLMVSLQVFRTMAPNLITDIRKYYPRAWRIFEGFLNEYIQQKVQANLDRGIAEGLYRPEIDQTVITQLRLAQISWFLGFQTPPSGPFSSVRLQVQLFDLYLHGIVNDAGRALLGDYLLQIREQVHGY
jgi:AcrR family transcriptional regulator